MEVDRSFYVVEAFKVRNANVIKENTLIYKDHDRIKCLFTRFYIKLLNFLHV